MITLIYLFFVVIVLIVAFKNDVHLFVFYPKHRDAILHQWWLMYHPSGRKKVNDDLTALRKGFLNIFGNDSEIVEDDVD